jgi:hypothetical protein
MIKSSPSPSSSSSTKKTRTRGGRKSAPRNHHASASKVVSKVSKVRNAGKARASSPGPSAPQASLLSSRAIVVRQPSWIGNATLARSATSAPAVRWAEGWDGFLQHGVVNLLTGPSGQGKSSVAGSMAAAQSNAGKHVLIYRSAEDSISKWNRRIELMGGNLDNLAYTDNAKQVWSILESADPPALLILDPLQQFLGIGVNNGAAARASMNLLTELAAKHSMVMLGVIHWKEYADKLMGSDEIRNIARVILKFEHAGSENGKILRRVKSNDAPANMFVRFRTLKIKADDPPQVEWESKDWQEATDGREADEREIETFLRNLHRDLPIQVEWIKKEVEDHGWMNYKRHVSPWFKRNGWVNKRGGQRLTPVLAKAQEADIRLAKRMGDIIIPKGKFWWVPARGKGYKWHKDDGGWLQWTGNGGWEKIDDATTVWERQMNAKEDQFYEDMFNGKGVWR